MELVTPPIESASQPIGLDQDLGEGSIPHRKDPFQEAEMRILPFKAEMISLQTLPQKAEFLLHLLQWNLRLPLERRVGFRDKGGDTHIDVRVKLLPLSP